MKVLIACECSGAVRDAFIKRGHDAMSCDIKPTEVPGPHYEGDVFDIISKEKWDLMIAHPPCTHLSVSGSRHFPAKIADGRQQAALDFVWKLMQADIPQIAIENPISVISSKIRKPDQIVHPWMFGDKASKSTCLWLKNLPLLVPTNIVEKGEFKEWICEKTGKKKRQPMWYYEASLLPKSQRGTVRSRTFMGIANAMADQWGADFKLNDR
jgi:site-specific DNA-cytosine methylase